MAGRLEMQNEVLPDEVARLRILEENTKDMKTIFDPTLDLQHIASRTRNFTRSELVAVVRMATGYAFSRQASLTTLSLPTLTVDDFLSAILDVSPRFGVPLEDLQPLRMNGIVQCSEQHGHVYRSAMGLVEKLKLCERGSLLTCLLEGPLGSGKTALAASIAVDSGFPCVKVVSADQMISLSEISNSEHISQVFEEVWKSNSVVILDDIERLVGYIALGKQHSNTICCTLLQLLRRPPPKGKKLLVVGTTAEVGFLDLVGLNAGFSVSYHVPNLSSDGAWQVLQNSNLLMEEVMEAAVAESLDEVPIKTLFRAIQMAEAHPERGSTEKINLNHLLECIGEMRRRH